MPGILSKILSNSIGRMSMLATAAASMLLSGCQAVSSNSPTSSQLRIIYASPDTGGVDIYAGASVLAYNLGFGTITSYIPITPSTYTLNVDQANTRTVVASARASLALNKQYTLLVGNAAANLQAQVLSDQSGPAPSGQISLRFLDQATKIGAVDIYAVPSSTTLTKTNPIATDVLLGGNTGYINIPVGTYKLYVLTAGTTPVDTTVPLYAGGNTTYPQGSARSVVLLDTQVVTTPGVQVITANDYDSATAAQ